MPKHFPIAFYGCLCFLEVEEAAAIDATWQGAGLGTAEDLIPPAGNGVVGGITDKFGEELNEERRAAPESAYLLEYENSGGGAGEQRLVR